MMKASTDYSRVQKKLLKQKKLVFFGGGGNKNLIATYIAEIMTRNFLHRDNKYEKEDFICFG